MQPSEMPGPLPERPGRTEALRDLQAHYGRAYLIAATEDEGGTEEWSAQPLAEPGAAPLRAPDPVTLRADLRRHHLEHRRAVPGD